MGGGGFSWNGLSDLMPPDGAPDQEVQREVGAGEAFQEASPAGSINSRLVSDKDLSGNGPGDLEEDCVEQDDDGNEARGRLLPNLTPGAEERRSRGICFEASPPLGHDLDERSRPDPRRTASDLPSEHSSQKRGSLTHRGSLRGSALQGEQY